MTTDHKKPGLAFWATVVVVVVLVAYPLSFGPVCWWFSPQAAPQIYWPIGWLAVNDTRWSREVILVYASRGGRTPVLIPANWNGTERFAWYWPGK
jgi:hypothetical protein